jgi:hypothetical protein
VFLDDDPVPVDQIDYGTLTLTVGTEVENLVFGVGSDATTESDFGPGIGVPVAQPLTNTDAEVVDSVLQLAADTSPTEWVFGQLDLSSRSWWQELDAQRIVDWVVGDLLAFLDADSWW